MALVVSSIEQAAILLRRGEVLAFPTETVYGLGANAFSFEACQKIYEFKNRPAINPLIVHVANIAQALGMAQFSDLALKIAEKFWPGPLTIVLNKLDQAQIASNVTAGLDTIAIRMPSHPITRSLLEQVELPIAAPSANLSTYVTSTKIAHVLSDFSNKEIYVLDHNTKADVYGLESTIIDASSANLSILRSGYILPEDIEKACGIQISKLDKHIDLPKAPGMLFKHYAPKAKLRLNAGCIEKNEVGLDFNKQLNSIFSLSLNGDLYEAAVNLYDLLRQADEYAMYNNLRQIAVAKVPNCGIGIAINDRLSKASK